MLVNLSTDLLRTNELLKLSDDSEFVNQFTINPMAFSHSEAKNLYFLYKLIASEINNQEISIKLDIGHRLPNGPIEITNFSLSLLQHRDIVPVFQFSLGFLTEYMDNIVIEFNLEVPKLLDMISNGTTTIVLTNDDVLEFYHSRKPTYIDEVRDSMFNTIDTIKSNMLLELDY